MDTAIAFTTATIVVGVYVIAIVLLCREVIKSDRLTSAEKFIWVVVVVYAPIVGALAWGLAGPHPFGFRLSSLFARAPLPR